MFKYSLEEIKTAERIYLALEKRFESLVTEFGMTCVNGKIYVLDSYGGEFIDREDSLTDMYVSNIDNREDTLLFRFPTSWIWDESGTHKNAYFEWKDKCPKIIYRPHKGTYQESMSQMRRFHTEEEMFEYIAKNNEFIANTSSLLVGDEIIYDKRNTWNTRYVLCNNYAGKELENPICIGMCTIDP